MIDLEFNHINRNYSDFAYRLEDFFQVIPFEHQRLTKLDALLLYAMVRGLAPDRVLEIGRCYGTSTMTISGALCDNNHGHLYSVDIEDLTSERIKNLTRDWATEYVLDSSDILAHALLQQQRFQMFFVDGDHSVRQQITDISTCLCLSGSSAWLIMHDAELSETQQAIALACKQHQELLSFGRLGDQLHLLRKIVPDHMPGIPSMA